MGAKRLVKLGRLLGHAGLVLCNGNDDDLHGCDPRRQHETVVVAVRHDDAADDAGFDQIASGGVYLDGNIRGLDFKPLVVDDVFGV